MSQLPLENIVAAIGGLGTAAFGLVDATKVFGDFGVNRIGFKRIAEAVAKLTPGAGVNGLSQGKVLDTLRANWYNGTDLGSQKAIAKSLIKLNLNPDNAAALARATGVDPDILTAVARSIAAGTTLSPAQSDVYGRFDLILTALLDEVYQHGDQAYRNGTRVWAVVFSIALALGGAFTLQKSYGLAVLVGLLATPLAPIAKDLSSALAAAVNAMQAVKK
jgi:hypothetical protein